MQLPFCALNVRPPPPTLPDLSYCPQLPDGPPCRYIVSTWFSSGWLCWSSAGHTSAPASKETEKMRLETSQKSFPYNGRKIGNSSHRGVPVLSCKKTKTKHKNNLPQMFHNMPSLRCSMRFIAVKFRTWQPFPSNHSNFQAAGKEKPQCTVRNIEPFS